MTEGDDALDDLISSTRAARRNSADALDELIADSGAAPRSAPEPAIDRVEQRRGWARALSFALAALALSGVLADAVAASQLISHAGPDSLGIVWPLGGLSLLLVAFLQTRFIDRFSRMKVLVTLCVVYGAAFVLAVALFAVHAPKSIPAGLAWLLADQMNFLFPLVVWTLAGDVFTSGQGVTVFPLMSRWLFLGQIAGLLIAVLFPVVFDLGPFAVNFLLLIPPIACFAVVFIVPRALRDASVSKGHGREVSSTSVVRETVAYVRELTAFRWLLWVSLAVMIAGAMVEFSFFDVISERFDSASDLQVVYAGTSLAGFLLCWLIQSFAATPMLNRLGIDKVLAILPVATVVAAVLLIGAIGGGIVPMAVVGLLLWRIPRWSVDASARQSAMATVPDERRAATSFLIDLVPFALGLVVVAIPIGLSRWLGQGWIVPAIAAVFAAVSVVFARKVVSTWDDTQLSYRLKRRKRLG
jgi:hypothetical protein